MLGRRHPHLMPDQEETQHRAMILINLLTQLGIRVNHKKSMKEAKQSFTYVGHVFDLTTHVISPIPEKSIKTIKFIKHQTRGNNFQPRALAGLAGHLLDAAKSNVAFHGLPQQLMTFAARGVNRNVQEYPWRSRQFHWNSTRGKPVELKTILRTCLHAAINPNHRLLRAMDNQR